jgi:hypothetical protein
VPSGKGGASPSGGGTDRDHNDGLPSSVPERGVRVKSVGKGESEEGMRAEYTVSIRSLRVRLLDPDNLYLKDLIDQIRYAGLIPEDTPEVVEIDITQKKVSSYKEEKTEIKITRNWRKN